jgi:cytosine/adenosine deaminase-related metal-dependent hydrolase
VRTVIRGGWVVAFADGAHALLRDGVVVCDDDRITGVGSSYSGRADLEIDARGKLVSPGLIDTHVHVGTRATHRLIVDSGRKDLYGQPFLHWVLTRPGSRAPGDLRFDAGDDPLRNPDRLAVLFTVAELLRNGTTTFVEIGSRARLQDLFVEHVGEYGLRAYLGPGYQSVYPEGDEHGRPVRVPTEDGGRSELETAVDWIRRHDGAAGGLVRGLLVPRETEFVAPDLLQETVRLKEELGVPVQIHAAYSPLEWQYVVEHHGCTPVEFLERMGLVGPGVTFGHGQLVAENPLSNWAGGRDLEILAQTGTSVAHSPINIIRRGRSFDFAAFVKAGVNLSLGTDTYPRDLILQMRWASYVGKVVSGDFTAASAGEVFEAATLGGARALQRDDIGRLAPGAKADVIVVGLRAPDSLRHGVVRDPIHALVDCGYADDVETVLVNGIVRMRDRRIPGLDLEALLDAAQEAAERYWGSVQDWDPFGLTAEQRSPHAFPLLVAAEAVDG